MMGIRVVLGDDHAVVRTGVCGLLTSHGIDVVAEAQDGRQLLREVRTHRPDIALVDLSMPLLDGIEATRRIVKISPETRVVVLTMHADSRFVGRARQAGALGYVQKDAAVEQLIDVICRVAAGECCLPPCGELEEDQLTAKEREVLQLICEGKKNAEIAQIMSRSVHTVRNHRAHLMKKLGARTGSQLVDAAVNLELACWTRPAERKP